MAACDVALEYARERHDDIWARGATGIKAEDANIEERAARKVAEQIRDMALAHDGPASADADDVVGFLDAFATEALSRYGHEAQLGMVREELPELLVALARRDRGRATDADVIDECADALIVLWQLRHMLGAVQVDEVVQQKIARQRARMGEP